MTYTSVVKQIIMQIQLHGDVAADTLLPSNKAKPLEWKPVQFSFLLFQIQQLEKQLPMPGSFR